MSLDFRDDIFDDGDGEWLYICIDEHFTQRFRCGRGPAIWCETRMTVHGTTDTGAALTLIYGRWDWWGHGRIAGFARNNDGSIDQVLSPVWWFTTRVALHILPPVTLPALRGWRVPLLLTRHFAGPSSIDIYPDERENALIVRGRFHGVKYQVPVVPGKLAEWLHLCAEAGTMPPPLPKGTGWVGLLRRLEAAM